MSDFFYKLVRFIGHPVFIASSSAVYLHRDRVCRPGAYILAPNHFSPYDVPCLIAAARRNLDFVSITELYRNPLVAWFFTALNCFALDRSKPDAPTVRIIYDRLEQGRAVVMFPEGGIRDEANSVLNGGPIKPGVARIAQRSKTPIIPCVILGTSAYHRAASWLPLRRVRYGIIFGEPILPRENSEDPAAEEKILNELLAAYRQLYRELADAMDKTARR